MSFLPRLFCIDLRFLRQLRLRLAGVSIREPNLLAAGIDCRTGARKPGRGRIEIAPHVELETGVVLHAYGGSIRIADHVFIGPHAVIYGHGGVEIGDHTLIAMHCRILSSEHTIAEGGDVRSQPDILKPTRVGRNVWLGAGVTVLGGVTIGDGCVVGAGAVVTRSLEPGAIAVGVPARVVGNSGSGPATILSGARGLGPDHR